MINAFQGVNIPVSSVCAAVLLYKADFQDLMLLADFSKRPFVALWKIDFAGMFALLDKRDPINLKASKWVSFSSDIIN